MNGRLSERTTPLMISAMRSACSSLSITQGPAMRNRSPAPTRTLSIWKDKVKILYRRDAENLFQFCHFSVLSSRAKRGTCSSRRSLRLGGELSPSHFFRPQEHLDLCRVLLLFLFLPVFVRSAHECLKQRMRLQRFRFEFRMELASDEERMTGNLHHLNVGAVRSRAGNAQPGGHHGLFILAVELVTMPVPLADLGLAIHFVRQRSRLDLTRPCPQP